MHSKWINGQLCYWDTHQMRLLDAIGPNVRKYIDDFHHIPLASNLPTAWTNTAVEVGTGSSTVIPQDEVGGVIRLDAAANENDGIQMQLHGESFTLSTVLYMGVRWNISENTQSDAFVGLSVTDTTFLAGNPNDFIGFITHDGDANLDYQIAAGGTGSAVDTTVDLVNDTFVITEMFYDGNLTTPAIYVFVDGTFIAKVTANITATELRPTLAYLNGAGTMQHDGIEVDWFRCIQIQ